MAEWEDFIQEGGLDFQLLFASLPSSVLVLDRQLRIVAVSDRYLADTMRSREELLGLEMFEAFPDNPNDLASTGVRNLRASLERVLERGETHTMPVQKYDIARPISEGGGFEVRYWSSKNSPVLVDGEVKYIIHRVEDVTEFVRRSEQLGAPEEISKWRERAERLQAEVYTHSRSVELANAKLEAALEFSAGLLGSIKDGFFSLDPEWKFIYVNDQEVDRLGVSENEIIGHSFWEFFPEPANGVLHRKLGRTMLERVAVEFERFEERTCRWFEMRAYPSRQGLSCLNTDVTTRKLAEKRLAVGHSTALILSKAHSFEEAWPELLPELCHILEAQVSGLWMMEEEHNCLKCVGLRGCNHSPEAEDFVRESEHIRFLDGQSVPGRVWKENRPICVKNIEEEPWILRRDLALQAGFRGAMAFPISTDGEFFGVVEFFLKRFCCDIDASLMDIMASLGLEIAQFIQHKRAEAAREATNQELQRIWESVETALVHCSRDYRFVSANPAYARLSGFELDRIVGHPMEEVITQEGIDLIRPKIQRVLRGERVEYEAEIAFLSGQRRCLHMTYSADYDCHGQITGWFASLHDVTERKAAERALAEAQEKLKEHAVNLEMAVTERTAELRETIGELESFSYSLSHDLRAPLRAIQGFAKMVLETSRQELGEKETGLLGMIINASARLDRLILGVLAFTRVSRMNLPLGMVNLNLLLEEIIQEHPEFNEPEAEVQVCKPLLPVTGNEVSLTQCITNLLANGVKFIRPGQHPRLKIWTEPRGKSVRLWIEDNGIGIGEESIPHLFQIFSRLHSEAEYAGTGIGLAIVRRAVQRMGGEVGVESKPGEGSRFWIQLQGV